MRSLLFITSFYNINWEVQRPCYVQNCSKSSIHHNNSQVEATYSFSERARTTGLFDINWKIYIFSVRTKCVQNE